MKAEWAQFVSIRCPWPTTSAGLRRTSWRWLEYASSASSAHEKRPVYSQRYGHRPRRFGIARASLRRALRRSEVHAGLRSQQPALCHRCLLYTSDAADDLTRVDLGG